MKRERLEEIIKHQRGIIEELENKVTQLETNRDETLDLIYSNVVANGEVIDQLRKIEVKRILKILERGKKCD